MWSRPPTWSGGAHQLAGHFRGFCSECRNSSVRGRHRSLSLGLVSSEAGQMPYDGGVRYLVPIHLGVTLNHHYNNNKTTCRVLLYYYIIVVPAQS